MLRVILAALAFQTGLFGADALRVMSFNIRYANADDGENAWPKRREFLLDTIKDFNPDLLGTQEVLEDQREYIAKNLSDYTCVGVGRDDGKTKGEYSAIFFRKSAFEAIDSGTFWLSETPDKPGSMSWKTACTRVATWAKLKPKSGGAFMFLNTHWDHKSEPARGESAKLIRKWLGEHAAGMPVIVTGDFNCIEDGGAYSTLLGKDDPKLPLIDAYRETNPERSKNEATFHAFKGGETGSRIDWILHSKHFKATEAQIDRRSKEGRFPSDHFAVTAIIAPSNEVDSLFARVYRDFKMQLPPAMQTALDAAVDRLRGQLAENLYSCLLYGSAVRGNLVEGVSDINLLIVLNESTPESHTVIAEALRGKVRFEPFILGRAGLERSIQSFAIKFLSVRRNYRVLHGADVLQDLKFDPNVLRFVCEQAVRNLRLRTVHAYIVFGANPKRYTHHLIDTAPAYFTDISEVLRCAGKEIPLDYAERIPVIERELSADASVLKDLLALKQAKRVLSEAEITDYHSRLFRLLDATVRWMEPQWPLMPLAK